MNLGIVTGAILLVNLPFGCWRAHVRKFSIQWFLSIHLPVPLIIALRLYGGIGWHFITFPVLMAAFFAGQYAGGKLARR